jgi:antitoxin VapB
MAGGVWWAGARPPRARAVYIQRLTSTSARLSSRQENTLPRTRVFKSGNSQAVRIPAELAYEDAAAELAISRHGDVITLFPVRSGLKDAVARLRALPTPAEVEEREAIEMPDREADSIDRA